jgi:hypothetical protein
MSSKHTAKIFRWLRQVNEDSKLPATAAKIAICLSNLFNEDEGGMAWPSCKTIGDAIGKSKATARDLVVPIRSEDDLFDQEKPQPAEVFEAEKPQVSAHGKPQVSEIKPQVSGRKPWPAKETLSKTHGRYTEGKSQTRAPELFKKEVAEEKKQKNKRLTGDTAASFAAFWAAYPKRVGKLDAQKAFEKALDQADAATIVAGAKRHAVERADEPPKYTQHPARWLRAGGWLDETAPSPGGVTIDNVTGVLIEAPPRRNGYRREQTWDDVYRDYAAEIGGER